MSRMVEWFARQSIATHSGILVRLGREDDPRLITKRILTDMAATSD